MWGTVSHSSWQILSSSFSMTVSVNSHLLFKAKISSLRYYSLGCLLYIVDSVSALQVLVRLPSGSGFIHFICFISKCRCPYLDSDSVSLLLLLTASSCCQHMSATRNECKRKVAKPSIPSPSHDDKRLGKYSQTSFSWAMSSSSQSVFEPDKTM